MESKAEILGRTRRRINAARSRQGKSWEDVFGKCDKDNSGYLDYHELSGAVRETLGIPQIAICDYEMRLLFAEMDADKSGGVNIEELLDYLQQGFRTEEEIANRAMVRIQRVRKNLKMAFQKMATNEMALRKLFTRLDMDSDCNLSPYEFKTFVRLTLKLSFWDVNNTDIDDFYNFLDKDGGGISVDELISFVKTNHTERPKEFSFVDLRPSSPSGTMGSPMAQKKLQKRKTHKQQLLEESFRSTSLPDLIRVRSTPSVVSLGREFVPTTRNTLSLSAKMFFDPTAYGK